MDAQRVRIELDRILTSAAFADAERAIGFLRFVVNRALEGRAGEIEESAVAVEVLGRNPSFDRISENDISAARIGMRPTRAAAIRWLLYALGAIAVLGGARSVTWSVLSSISQAIEQQFVRGSQAPVTQNTGAA